jgi:hypothetical protein
MLDPQPAGSLNSGRNKGQKFYVRMVFVALKGCCSTEMDRVVGSDQKKLSFITNQLIGPARVLNKNKWNFVLLQIFFSQLLSKLCCYCFIYIVLFGFELIPYR